MEAYTHRPKIDGLFAEDFDLPEAAPEVAVIEPVFSAGEMAAAREAAWHDGHTAGLQEAMAGDATATRLAITAIAERFAAECADARASAERSAEAIARLLLDSLSAVFPTLCSRYGDEEVRAIVRTVVPALIQEPSITVRAHPRTAAAVTQETARLNAELAGRMQMIESDAMPPGDVRIAWRSGSATRDAAALWQEVAAVLAPAGLLRADTAIRETINGG
jgi:flagellar assembly protein FliH